MSDTVFLDDYDARIESSLKIVNKNGDLVPFKLNRAQKYVAEALKRKRRIVVAKARQEGISAYLTARNLLKATSKFGHNYLLITHTDQTTAILRERIEFWMEQLANRGELPAVTIQNKGQIGFGKMNSNMYFMTAGGENPARGATIHSLHPSEVASWPEKGKAFAAVLPSVPPDGEVEFESSPTSGPVGPLFATYTAAQMATQGASNGFEQWESIFIPWYVMEEYQRAVPDGFMLTPDEVELAAVHNLTNEQMYWRRQTYAELRALGQSPEQEYPDDDVTCFLSGEGLVLNLSDIVWMKGHLRKPLRTDGPFVRIFREPDIREEYIFGVDVAEGSGGKDSDYTAIVGLNAQTKEQVLTIHGRMSVPTAARLLIQWANYYNKAWLIIEVAPGIGGSLDALIPNYEKKVHANIPNASGLRMTAAMRDELTTNLQEMTSSRGFTIYDELLGLELRALSWIQKGYFRRAEAPEGSHDDLAFAFMLAIKYAKRAVIRRESGIFIPYG